ncbi:hypothetical protein [Mycolicibacterium goodii]|uniref:HTH cro/C1-type domain-containing protein n=1 Tax=Mycolicibacterium goodii TaxID=134601 RepID=A0ABS6HNG6_MYCGD|nr:hypothetical protein [Mycolicibacterium goodii]MBU8824175.1 hypothetical protein [Mycolicibacterium goodii]MBU8838041.1 hypothetical protein [Mycolicibacterium goodii]
MLNKDSIGKTLAYVRNDIGVIKFAGSGCIRMFAKGGYCLPNFSGIVGRMTTNLDWERLGRFVRAARGARAQADIAANGGPSDETLSKIEQGRWRPTRSVQKTLEKLELGLGWAPGSANAVLAGGEPTHLHADETQAAASQAHQPSSHVPEFLPAAQLTWEVVNDLVNSPEGDPLREWKGQRAVVATADTLTDALLRLNVGPAAKSLIQEMGHAAHQLMKDQIFAIQQANKEEDDHDAEAATQSDASDEMTRAAARTASTIERKLEQLLAEVAYIDPTLDIRAEFHQQREALEPVLDTPMGQRAWLQTEINFVRRAAQSLRTHQDDPTFARRVQELIAEAETIANTGLALVGAGESSQRPVSSAGGRVDFVFMSDASSTPQRFTDAAPSIDDLGIAARTTPTGYRKGQADNGDAIGEESQDSDLQPPSSRD